MGLLSGESYKVMLWIVGLIGVAYGGLFPLSLAFLAMRTKSAMQAAIKSSQMTLKNLNGKVELKD